MAGAETAEGATRNHRRGAFGRPVSSQPTGVFMSVWISVAVSARL